MVVAWVYAMTCEVGRICVIKEGVEWCDGWVQEEIGECGTVRMGRLIEGCID